MVVEEADVLGEGDESKMLIDLEIVEGDVSSRVARGKVIQSVMEKAGRRDL